MTNTNKTLKELLEVRKEFKQRIQDHNEEVKEWMLIQYCGQYVNLKATNVGLKIHKAK